MGPKPGPFRRGSSRYCGEASISTTDKGVTFCALVPVSADFLKDNSPCFCVVHGNYHPFLVLIGIKWCEVMFFSQNAKGGEVLQTVRPGDFSDQLTGKMIKNELLYGITFRSLGCTATDLGFQTVQRSTDCRHDAMASFSNRGEEFSPCRDRTLRHSENGFAVAVAHKRLRNRSIVGVTVSELSSPGLG